MCTRGKDLKIETNYMDDFLYLKQAVPQMIYEIMDCNDKKKYKYDLHDFRFHNLFQLYRNEIGNPDKYIKILYEDGFFI
jgi:hypothetical protein